VLSHRPIIQSPSGQRPCLASHPASAAALNAFVEVLEQVALFPPKDQPSQTGGDGAQQVDLQHLPEGVLSPSGKKKQVKSKSKSQPRVYQELADPHGLIPVLGRSAAGIPHFWINPEDSAGVTDLTELIDRHSATISQNAKPARLAGAGLADCTAALVQIPKTGEDDLSEFVLVSKLKALYPDAFALRIDGDSMSPDILHGDVVILSPSAPAVDGKPAVVQIKEQVGVTCKLYRRSGRQVHLIAINEQIPPTTIQAGKVVWALRVLGHIRPS